MKPWEVMRRFGAGVPAVYATAWDAAKAGSGLVISSAGLTCTNTVGTDRTVLTTTSKSSGKWCLPVLIGKLSGPAIDIGLATTAVNLSSFLGSDAAGHGYDSGNGRLYTSGGSSAYGSTFGTDDVIEILYDASSGELRFTLNGSIQHSGLPAETGLAGPRFAAVSIGKSTDFVTIHGTLSSYASASGYSMWD